MAAFKYEFKTPGIYKVSAEVVGEVCEQLQDSAAGLSPATLLDASRDENAPLHGEFIWNDSEAAEKYRLSQAAGMIRNLTIISKRTDGSEVRDRAYVSAPGGNSKYMALSHAMSRIDLREHMLKQARMDCTCFMAKYKRLQELTSVVDAMQMFVDTPVE